MVWISPDLYKCRIISDYIALTNTVSQHYVPPPADRHRGPVPQTLTVGCARGLITKICPLIRPTASGGCFSLRWPSYDIMEYIGTRGKKEEMRGQVKATEMQSGLSSLFFMVPAHRWRRAVVPDLMCAMAAPSVCE